jgi:deoxyxylulose-5-phosphate synthase
MMKSNSSEASESAAPPQRLLDRIRSPADIKTLREQDLAQLAQEVRDELIKVLSQTGGHLGPNLGVVELTIALHRVFDTPRDRFVMDVSHQGYVHKMFTGRLDRFSQCGSTAGSMVFFCEPKASMIATAQVTQGPRFPPGWVWRSDAI